MLISRLYSRRGSSDGLLFLRPERLWLARNNNQSNEKRVSGEGEKLRSSCRYFIEEMDVYMGIIV